MLLSFWVSRLTRQNVNKRKTTLRAHPLSPQGINQKSSHAFQQSVQLLRLVRPLYNSFNLFRFEPRLRPDNLEISRTCINLKPSLPTFVLAIQPFKAKPQPLPTIIGTFDAQAKTGLPELQLGQVMPRLRIESTLVRRLRFATLPDLRLRRGDFGLQLCPAGDVVVFLRH